MKYYGAEQFEVDRYKTAILDYQVGFVDVLVVDCFAFTFHLLFTIFSVIFSVILKIYSVVCLHSFNTVY